MRNNCTGADINLHFDLPTAQFWLTYQVNYLIRLAPIILRTEFSDPFTWS